ncbi:MAG TPA: EamA family transporter [Streptosporangiaceae bacterium]|nr:EamA family transporter [Streptosporangiaceae bacterium]
MSQSPVRSLISGGQADGTAGGDTGSGGGVRHVGWFALLIVWVVWGSTYFAIRVGVATIPPFVLAGVRYLIAGLVLLPFAMRSGPVALRRTDRPRPRHWWSAALVGVLLLSMGNGGVSLGERTVPSGLASLLVATVPLWLIVIDRVVNGARVRRVALAGLLAGVAGVGLLSGLLGHLSGPSGHRGGPGAGSAGILIILVASASWASGTIVSRRLPLPARPLLATAMQMIAGGAVLTVAAVVSGELTHFDPARVSVASLLALLYLIGPGSILALTAYVVAVRHLPTPTVATYAYVNPVIAVILGTSLLGEALTLSMLLGGAMVIVAVILVLKSQGLAGH